jgi:hypothetical protein
LELFGAFLVVYSSHPLHYLSPSPLFLLTHLLFWFNHVPPTSSLATVWFDGGWPGDDLVHSDDYEMNLIVSVQKKKKKKKKKNKKKKKIKKIKNLKKIKKKIKKKKK